MSCMVSLRDLDQKSETTFQKFQLQFLSIDRGVRHTLPSPGSAAWHSKHEVGSLTIFWGGKAMQVLSLAVTREHSSCLALQHSAHSALSSLDPLIRTEAGRKTAQKWSTSSSKKA